VNCLPFTKVFLVLGNHEFYGISRIEGLELAKSLEREPILKGKFVILHGARVDLDPNNTVLGCTLHTHVLPEARQIVEAKVKDFKRISGWTVDDHNSEHNLDVEWLRNQIDSVRQEKNRSHRVVVITHHAPSIRETSNSTEVDSPWSSAFGTDRTHTLYH
jgi:hypothetical protein